MDQSKKIKLIINLHIHSFYTSTKKNLKKLKLAFLFQHKKRCDFSPKKSVKRLEEIFRTIFLNNWIFIEDMARIWYTNSFSMDCRDSVNRNLINRTLKRWLYNGMIYFFTSSKRMIIINDSFLNEDFLEKRGFRKSEKISSNITRL